MAAEQDPRANGSGEKKPGKSHRELMRALWLPVPEAPANDNERGALWLTFVFLRRHLNWMLPTLALAALSIILLNLNHT